jgi:hypothetical protein
MNLMKGPWINAAHCTVARVNLQQTGNFSLIRARLGECTMTINPNITFCVVVRDLTSFKSISQPDVVNKLDFHWWGRFLRAWSGGEFQRAGGELPHHFQW